MAAAELLARFLDDQNPHPAKQQPQPQPDGEAPPCPDLEDLVALLAASRASEPASRSLVASALKPPPADAYEEEPRYEAWKLFAGQALGQDGARIRAEWSSAGVTSSAASLGALLRLAADDAGVVAVREHLAGSRVVRSKAMNCTSGRAADVAALCVVLLAPELVYGPGRAWHARTGTSSERPWRRVPASDALLSRLQAVVAPCLEEEAAACEAQGDHAAAVSMGVVAHQLRRSARLRKETARMATSMFVDDAFVERTVSTWVTKRLAALPTGPHLHASGRSLMGLLRLCRGDTGLAVGSEQAGTLSRLWQAGVSAVTHTASC